MNTQSKDIDSNNMQAEWFQGKQCPAPKRENVA